MQIKCTINGQTYNEVIEDDLILLDFLRLKGFLSIKRGCDTSSCGLCTVWLEENPVLSCSVLAASVNGKAITTLEGLQEEAKAFGHFLASEGADQCGFCSPGLVMTVIAMKKQLHKPSEEEIKHYLTGNLCRCTGYMGQLRAITKYVSKEADTHEHS